MRRIAGSNALFCRVTSRSFSTPPPQLQITPELVKKSEDRVEKRKKFLQESVSPKGFVQFGSVRDAQCVQNPAELAAFSGMPAEHQSRTVLIASRPKKFLQSGEKYVHQWTIKWKPSSRWTNPLMGWTSSADPMTSVELHFNSSDDAVAFAKSNGWKYELLAPAEVGMTQPGTASYADNFLPPKVMQKLRREGKASTEFTQSGRHDSNWFQPLTYHGTNIVRQHGDRVERPYPAL